MATGAWVGAGSAKQNLETDEMVKIHYKSFPSTTRSTICHMSNYEEILY